MNQQTSHPKPYMSAYCPVIDGMAKEYDSCPKQLPPEAFIHDRAVILKQSFSPRHQTCAYCRHWNNGQPVEYPQGISKAISDAVNRQNPRCDRCQHFEWKPGEDSLDGFCSNEFSGKRQRYFEDCCGEYAPKKEEA